MLLNLNYVRLDLRPSVLSIPYTGKLNQILSQPPGHGPWFTILFTLH